MTETFLYLTTIGHKSGNSHEIEIWYVENNGLYYLCSGSGEKSHWVQNILAQPQVTFSVGTRDDKGILETSQPAIARSLTPETDKNLHHIVTQLFNGKYGWSAGLLVEIKGNQEEE